jgi:hypothetical protein
VLLLADWLVTRKAALNITAKAKSPIVVITPKIEDAISKFGCPFRKSYIWRASCTTFAIRFILLLEERRSSFIRTHGVNRLANIATGIEKRSPSKKSIIIAP